MSSLTNLERLILDTTYIIENTIATYKESNITYLDRVTEFIERSFFFLDYSKNLILSFINITKGTPKVVYILKLVKDNYFGEYQNHFSFTRLMYTYNDIDKYVYRIYGVKAYIKNDLFSFIEGFFEYLYHLSLVNKMFLEIENITTILKPTVIRLSSVDVLSNSYHVYDINNIMDYRLS